MPDVDDAGAVVDQALLRGLAASRLVDAHLTGDKGQARETCRTWITSVLAP
ncbi:hypothetical protein [Yinghuangia sp. ASG 101]|uniref:hypothetical protein n=1 Tax=Yinghuangia sp. ASG 101 TaxID=2896848 RepID=UPI002F911B44